MVKAGGQPGFFHKNRRVSLHVPEGSDLGFCHSLPGVALRHSFRMRSCLHSFSYASKKDFPVKIADDLQYGFQSEVQMTTKTAFSKKCRWPPIFVRNSIMLEQIRRLQPQPGTSVIGRNLVPLVPEHLNFIHLFTILLRQNTWLTAGGGPAGMAEWQLQKNSGDGDLSSNWNRMSSSAYNVG